MTQIDAEGRPSSFEFVAVEERRGSGATELDVDVDADVGQ